jgi:ABC-type multidrug transport system fused ATPase/permease subunit
VNAIYDHRLSSAYHLTVVALTKQRKFLKEHRMKEEIKHRLQKNETWQRILYMLFFIFIYGFAKFLIFAIMLFQLATLVISGKTNEQLLRFSQNLSTYIYQITIFLTFVSEQQPFPFSAWPDGVPDKESRYLDE